jgi:hypothetical protein
MERDVMRRDMVGCDVMGRGTVLRAARGAPSPESRIPNPGFFPC